MLVLARLLVIIFFNPNEKVKKTKKPKTGSTHHLRMLMDIVSSNPFMITFLQIFAAQLARGIAKRYRQGSRCDIITGNGLRSAGLVAENVDLHSLASRAGPLRDVYGFSPSNVMRTQEFVGKS